MAKKTALIPKSKAKTAYDLLSEVIALIRAEPKRYNQNRFIGRQGEAPTGAAPIGYPACGTVGCVAGWVATLKSPGGFSYGATESIARRVLGLDYVVAEQLFAGGIVPGEPQTVAHARHGAAHIRRFQKQYEKQLKAKRV